MVVDSRSVRVTELGGVRGHDAGQKAKERQRHAVVSTAAGRSSSKSTRRTFEAVTGPGRCCEPSRPNWPFVQLAHADWVYQRLCVASPIRVEIVRKIEEHVGFVTHARRWVSERFFSWINRNRRLASDIVATIASAEASRSAASAITVLSCTAPFLAAAY